MATLQSFTRPSNGSFQDVLHTSLIMALVIGSFGLIYLVWAREATPLRKIPGPYLASVSKLWMIYKTRQLKRHELDLELHDTYGPVVRIGPNYVLVSSPGALKTIYGAGTGAKFAKDSFYDIAGGSKDGLDLLPEKNMEKYRLQRRLFGPIYTASSVKDYEAALDSAVKEDVATMHEIAGKPENADLWFNYLALDCLSSSTFSTSYGMVKKGKDDGSIAAIHSSWYHMHWAGFLPTFVKYRKRLQSLIAWFSRPLSLEGPPPMFAWALGHIEARKQGKETAESPDLAEKIFQLEAAKPEWKEDWSVNMILTNFGAGVETLGVTLSEVVIQAIANPNVQAKIHAEIDKAKKDGYISDPPKLGEMQRELPYLQACLDEAMRLHNVTGVMFPRVVPASGVTIDGYFIPGGTTVGINPWVLGRDRSLYGQDARSFRPERWLEMSTEQRSSLEKYSMRFGMGVRSCPGQNVAQAIMSKILPTMFMHFEWGFVDPSADRKLVTTFVARYVNVMVKWQARNRN